MKSSQSFFLAVQARIGEYLEDAKATADYNHRNGWDVDAMIADADEEALELIREIEKLSYFLDEENLAELTRQAEEAYSKVEDYIIETYGG